MSNNKNNSVGIAALPVKKGLKMLPKVLLVGSFDDLFLEAISNLGYEFNLNKSSKPSQNSDYDIVFIDADRSDQALDYIKKYKAVPILFLNKKSKDKKVFFEFDAISESGNAFFYKENTAWHKLEALIRASETFKFKYDWKNLLLEVKDVAKFID